ncbi:MAG: PolC-type DNA polymerase III [Microgenomates group bacterium]
MAKIRELAYVAFDLEATCHPSTKYHEIIEIGAVKLIPNNLEIKEEFETLVRPSTPIIQPIIKKTGITDKIVEKAPLIHEVWDNFLSFIQNTILVGHQVFLDLGILNKTAQRHGLKPINAPAIDTMRLSRRLYPNEPSYGLEHLQKIIALEVKVHRAKTDALVTGLLFKYFVEILENKYQILEFKDLQDFCFNSNPFQTKLF